MQAAGGPAGEGGTGRRGDRPAAPGIPHPARSATAAPALTVFSPLPPARSGIADYAARLILALQERGHYACAAATEAWEEAAAPDPEVPVLDAALAALRLGPGDRVLHQLGNNRQHGFVLRALRHCPGVVTLHDPGLLHLHEVAGEPAHALLAAMAAGPAPIAPVLARQRRDAAVAPRAAHLLLDLAGEVLARARGVVVHSRFAAARLGALRRSGGAPAAPVAVVPHMLPAAPMPERAAARARLGLAAEEVLVLTAGFATRAKRFDWVAAALAQLGDLPRLRWIHAGEERPEELDLSGLIEARGLASRARVTGWLEEAALDAHIAAADVLVNLRFPSTGESSGALARAFAAGTCCIVTDTAAYAELPRAAVVHVPPAGAVPALAAALRALARDPALAREIGAAGQRFAAAEMALPAIAARYAEAIEAAQARPLPVQVRQAEIPLRAVDAAAARRRPAAVLADALAGLGGRCRLFLGAADAAALAGLSLDQPAWLARALPPEARLLGLRVQLPPAAPGLLLDLDLPEWRA